MKSERLEIRITPETKAKGFAVARHEGKSLANIISESLEAAYLRLPIQQQQAIKNTQTPEIVKMVKNNKNS